MKNPISKSVIALTLLLSVSFSLQAKILYVKQAATGDGSSWANASGDIQAMIDKSVYFDQVWVAKGTYFPTVETVVGDARSRSFVTKNGVPLCGGFAGTETSLAQRALADLDNNGKVDSFEFVNTTLLSGDIDRVADVWTKTMNTDKKTWKWTVTGNQGNCYCVVTMNFSIDGVSVIGGNANSTTLNKGGGIFAFSYVNPNIKNCTVSNCSAVSRGGGISSTFSGSCIITNCSVSNCNAGSNGGGISFYSQSSSSTSSLTNCIVSNCSAGTSGGGISYDSYTIYDSSSSSKVTNCTVSSCSAGFGGGIYYSQHSSSSSPLTNCTISNCSAGSSGGGIYSNYSYSKVTNCTISNCSAVTGNGGGIYSTCYSSSYSTFLTNCTISNCSAGSSGGGIYYDDFCSITNCTISNCSAVTGNGGGIYYNYAYSSSSPLTNCTVNNCYGGGIYASSSYVSVMNCAVSNNKVGATISNISGGTQTGNISPDISLAYLKPTSFVGVATTDAQKAELITADWRLRKGSPCINAGTNNILTSILMGKDFDGNPRLLYGIVDAGAYEYSIPKVALPIFETFDSWVDFDKSVMLYSYSDVKTGLIKWSIENQKAVFSWKTNLTSTYTQPFFTYQIDGSKEAKVYLRYDMYFQPNAGTITPLGTENLNVEYSTDLITWSTIATYSNANGTIANQTYMHDISSLVAGQSFYIRFNANGENSNRIEKWEIDNIILDTEDLNGLVATKVDKLLCHVSNGQLAIRNIKEGSTVQLYDVNGQLVAKQLGRDNATNIALPHRGVYLVKVKTGNVEKSEKVVW